MPAVVVVTGQFQKLASTIMQSLGIPEHVAILVDANPEYVSSGELEEIAEQIAERAIAALMRRPASP